MVYDERHFCLVVGLLKYSSGLLEYSTTSSLLVVVYYSTTEIASIFNFAWLDAHLLIKMYFENWWLAYWRDDKLHISNTSALWELNNNIFIIIIIIIITTIITKFSANSSKFLLH